MFDMDPSKMDTKTLMELSNLMRQLPPEQIGRMQGLMHNMMAGFDVRRDMEEFEKSLPPGFREKLMAVFAASGMPSPSEPAFVPSEDSSASELISDLPPDLSADLSGAGMNVKEARLTILRAVSERRVNPEEALLLLFPSQKS